MFVLSVLEIELGSNWNELGTRKVLCNSVSIKLVFLSICKKSDFLSHHFKIGQKRGFLKSSKIRCAISKKKFLTHSKHSGLLSQKALNEQTSKQLNVSDRF